MIVFHAHYGYGIISTLIRLFSFGKYNHISIELDDYVYEAKEGKGVLKTKRSKWDNSTVDNSIGLKIGSRREKSIKAFLDRQVGKKYDYRGILGFLFILARPKKNAWYCSELAQVVLYKSCGVESVEAEYHQTVSPQTFWRTLLLVKKIIK